LRRTTAACFLPSGIPIGNLQAAFQLSRQNYGRELGEATYPDDNAATGPYPFYDRWSDTFNVTTEFIAVNQARSLMVAAFLACGSPASDRKWTFARAVIVPRRRRSRSTPRSRFGVEVPGESLLARPRRLGGP
jgi:hypothetical protein